MADEEEVDEPEGESLAQYISRLEALTGTERVRVPKQFIDKHGNVLLPPSAIYLVDSVGGMHESATTTGEVRVSPYGIGGGTHRVVQGTYTKGATGANGNLSITPDADDAVYFLYGVIATGGARAGGADELFAGIGLGAGSANIVQLHLYDATADASESWLFPGLGAVPTQGRTTTAGIYHPLLGLITGANLITADVGTAAAPTYSVVCNAMANTETFSVELAFYSTKSSALTATAGTSDTFA